MIVRLWSGRSPFWRFLLPLSWLYGLVSNLIRLCYRIGWKSAWHAPIPVVVVGNLTVGGNGKTPVVIWLVEQLKQRGIRIGVVSRGYGGRSTRYPLLVNSKTTTLEAGDEPILIYQRTGVPVAVSPKRRNAVKALLEKNYLQMVITDDGLQHYALARDVEIVVFDGVRRFGNGWWLPAGPMRERVSRLRSVDVIIANGGNAKKGEISMRLRPGLAINLLTNEQCEVAEINNLVAMAGIGYPSNFFKLLKQCGAKLSQCVSLADHAVLSAEKISAFMRPGQKLIMTEKDAVKCRSFAKENWWYLPVSAELNEDESEYLLQYLISLIEKKFSST